MNIRLRNALIAILFLVSFAALPPAFAQQTAPTEVKIDSKIFDAYTGQYRAPDIPDAVLSFFREGDKFYVQVTGQDRVEIYPSSESTFFLKVVEAKVEFVRDSATGKVTSVVLTQGGVPHTGVKFADTPARDERVPFVRTEAMIPMRDGVKLFTVILTPQKHDGNLPIIMERTPYSVSGNSSNVVNARKAELIKDGYVFVYQDIRGRYKSEGEFIMNRPLHDPKDPKGVDESTDTYDTIDWLLKNVPNNNGRVGMMGVSYPGWLAAVALVNPHPALKATSPQAPMVDTWMGDDFFHNGAFRQSYGHEYVYEMETAKDGATFSMNGEDGYDWYLRFKTLGALTERLGGKLPTWNSFVAHPAYDSFWQAKAAQLYIKHASVPTMIVGGWWDQEDMFGPLALYQALERSDKEDHVSLVMGPWNHGGWNGSGVTLADVNFGSPTGKYFRESIQAPWFAYYLHDKKPLKHAEATMFRSGSNEWKEYASWPPRTEATPGNLYFREGGKLSFEAPKKKIAGDSNSYISDPASPVPYRKRPIEGTYDPRGSRWRTWLAQDQSFNDGREDIATWSTDVLDKDVTISGDVIANLFASTTGSDSDWVVKLIDVYPDKNDDSKMDGYKLMIAEEIFRGRYLNGFTVAKPITPNAVNKYVIDLRGNDHTFLKGHKIMVQVQSSWFPLYDRNPQTFVDNIFLAKESDYQKATQTVYRSPKYPSNLAVMVAK